jgi:hypothetical protein
VLVERFVCEHLSSSLEHIGLCQSSVKHLLLLEVNPPRLLGVALELPSVLMSLRKVYKSWLRL